MATRKSTKRITSLGDRGVSWQKLAAVIAERALLEERAKVLTPKEAAKLRASEGAVQLERWESSMWEDLCSDATEYHLLARVNGGAKNRQNATAFRLRYILTDMSTALLDEARKGFRHGR
jgi:hypothetical protein